MNKKRRDNIIHIFKILILSSISIIFLLGCAKQEFEDIQEKPECRDIQEIELKYTNLASTAIKEFLESSVKDCSDDKMVSILQSCYTNKNELCNNGVSYCDYIKNKVSAFFNEKLEDSDYELTFEINHNKGETVLEYKVGTKCSSDEYIPKIKIYPMPLGVGSSNILLIKLKVCMIPRCS